MSQPRKGQSRSFRSVHEPAEKSDAVTGLHFRIECQVAGEATVDFRHLKPRRLALCFARALRALSAPGGPLRVRSIVKAYACSVVRYFDYIAEAADRPRGPRDLRAHHVDGFETWLEERGLSRTHLFTVLIKIVALLRAMDTPDAPLAADLQTRLRYVSHHPFQRSPPRDAYSPFVARQLRDAARADVEHLVRRLSDRRRPQMNRRLKSTIKAVEEVVSTLGYISHKHPAYKALYFMRREQRLPVSHLIEDVHGVHYLLARDLPPLLVRLSLETGLEIECCKSLTIDCLRNPSAGTVEVQYLKRRAHGAEHKRLRVRDGGLGTPGGLIRQLIKATAAARRHCPSEWLWVYFSFGRLRAGILQPRETLDAWIQAHGLNDDDGSPLRLTFSRLRKTHKALWYLKSEGHMARFAIGHTREVAARYYADVPSLRPLHEATVAQAFTEAVTSAFEPRVLSPAQEADWRAQPSHASPTVAPERVTPLLDGAQDVWLASCAGFYASPHGRVGEPCPKPFWGCLECSNAVITARKLPAILGFLQFIEHEREGLAAADWQIKFGRAYERITRQVLPAFSEALIAEARAALQREPSPTYLPPEATV